MSPYPSSARRPVQHLQRPRQHSAGRSPAAVPIASKSVRTSKGASTHYLRRSCDSPSSSCKLIADSRQLLSPLSDLPPIRAHRCYPWSKSCQPRIAWMGTDNIPSHDAISTIFSAEGFLSLEPQSVMSPYPCPISDVPLSAFSHDAISTALRSEGFLALDR